MGNESPVFSCRMCGQCCRGKGGIVVSPHDLQRLCRFLARDREYVAAHYLEESNGKLKIKCGADGWCIFYNSDAGCAAHAARPDICRAWPFFRGNLLDQTSFEMAREYCPGIESTANFDRFREEGLAWLLDNGVISRQETGEANSLIGRTSTRTALF